LVSASDSGDLPCCGGILTRTIYVGARASENAGAYDSIKVEVGVTSISCGVIGRVVLDAKHLPTPGRAATRTTDMLRLIRYDHSETLPLFPEELQEPHPERQGGRGFCPDKCYLDSEFVRCWNTGL
jgi:hypothetical protein